MFIFSKNIKKYFIFIKTQILTKSSSLFSNMFFFEFFFLKTKWGKTTVARVMARYTGDVLIGRKKCAIGDLGIRGSYLARAIPASTLRKIRLAQHSLFQVLGRFQNLPNRMHFQFFHSICFSLFIFLYFFTLLFSFPLFLIFHSF